MTGIHLNTHWTTSEKLTAVVVFYEKESCLAMLLARSMRLYLDQDLFSRIIFINNFSDLQAGHDVFQTMILPELGIFQGITTCLEPKDIGVDLTGSKDSYSAQQALKMEISRWIETPFYLVFDAKNHLVKPLGSHLLFAPDGRPRSYLSPYSGYLLLCLKTSYAFFNADTPENQFAYPTVTPSLLVTGIVRSMLDEIEGRAGKDLYQTIIENDKRTEFLLYSAYLDKSFGIDAIYDMGAKNYATLFARGPQEPDDVLQVLSTLDRPEVFAFGLHLRRFSQLTQDQIAWISDFWVRAGLFADTGDARNFIAREVARSPVEPDAADVESSARRDVLVGRNRRLFILDGTNKVMDQHRGKTVLSEAQVLKWKDVFEARSALCAARGATYAMMIVPDAHSVHRDEIPELDQIEERRPIFQLTDAMRDSGLLAYPLEALRKARGRGLVYHTTDSHWSGFGAYIGYLSMIDTLDLPLKKISEQEVDIFESTGPGDLGDKLDPPRAGAYTECVVRRPTSRKIWDNGIHNRGYMAYWRNENPDLPRGLLLMDSFGWKLQRFLAEGFSEMFLVHSPYYERDVVEAFSPDIVVSEMAERFITRVPDDISDELATVTASKKKPEFRLPYAAELRALP